MRAADSAPTAQVYKAAAAFVRLLWSGAVAGVETQPSIAERHACMLAALLALKLDAVRSRKHFQVPPSLLSPFCCSFCCCS